MSLTPITTVGQGFSTFRGEAVDTVIEGTPQNGGTGSTKVQISVCTSTAEILNALNIDASTEANCSWGSFKDRFSYTLSTSQRTNTVSILCVATRETGSTSISQPKFAKGHKHEKAGHLYDAGGDCYVSSITWGGQYIASFQFQATDTEQLETIKNDAEAGAGDGTTNVKVQLSTAISKASSSSSTNAIFTQSVIGVNQPNLPNSDGVVDFALGFVTQGLDKPEVLNFSVGSYRAVSGHPKDIVAMDNNRRLYSDPQTPTAGLGAQKVALLDAQAAVANTKRLYDFYHCASVEPGFDQQSKKYSDWLSQIDAWAKAVDADPTTTKAAVPKIDTSQITKPVAVYSLLSGPWGGGHGGNSYVDVSIHDVATKTRMSYISIRGNAAVDSLVLGYQSNLPQSKAWETGRHGGDGGDDYPRITFGDFEIVKQVDVKWSSDDQVCKVITFTTDKQTVHAPNSPEGDQTATWTGVEGKQCFFGLAGNAHSLVDACQVLYVEFSAAQWS